METKRASFAGAWYPDTGQACENQIKAFLKDKKGPLKGNFKGGIVPHAGWMFSGSIACRTIASLASRQKADLVFIFGMHMHSYSNPCILTKGMWETPLGPLSVQEALAAAIAEKQGITPHSPRTFPEENTIELQLPFVKYFFPHAFIVPMGIPPSPLASEIGRTAAEEAEKMGLDSVIVGSTDLTHYGVNFGFTPAGTGEEAHAWVRNENDEKAVQSILAMDEAHILAQAKNHHNLCCAGAVAAAVAGVKRMGADRAVRLDYATSYEKQPGNSFVGYTGILFEYQAV